MLRGYMWLMTVLLDRKVLEIAMEVQSSVTGGVGSRNIVHEGLSLPVWI
jgi:hypothetical protein